MSPCPHSEGPMLDSAVVLGCFTVPSVASRSVHRAVERVWREGLPCVCFAPGLPLRTEPSRCPESTGSGCPQRWEFRVIVSGPGKGVLAPLPQKASLPLCMLTRCSPGSAVVFTLRMRTRGRGGWGAQRSPSFCPCCSPARQAGVLGGKGEQSRGVVLACVHCSDKNEMPMYA